MTPSETGVPLDQSRGGIKCCICLNQGQNVEATTTIKGYSVCENHIKLVSQTGFDIMRLRANTTKVV